MRIIEWISPESSNTQRHRLLDTYLKALYLVRNGYYGRRFFSPTMIGARAVRDCPSRIPRSSCQSQSPARNFALRLDLEFFQHRTLTGDLSNCHGYYWWILEIGRSIKGQRIWCLNRTAKRKGSRARAPRERKTRTRSSRSDERAKRGAERRNQ